MAMNCAVSRGLFAAMMSFCAVTGCSVMDDREWQEMRKAAVERPRSLVYNTDGCDVLYWPSNLPVTVGNFTGRRLRFATGTRITTVSYCPQSAGFGHFTCRNAGEPLTNSVPHPAGGHYNSAAKFFEIGTDALEMASDWCRTNSLEMFVSIRINDQHDSSSRPGNMSALYPPFKVAHPECIMGDLNRGDRQKELYRGYAGWSCVDFSKPTVRERMKRFVRELVTNYGVDGIEYDFNRHFMLFRSVATGGVATADEIETMTQLMRDLKTITEDVGKSKRRPIVIAMRMPDSVEYDMAVGADIETWFREGLVDIWIGGGYFQLNQWERSAALAHRYGVRFYASIDESRIGGYVKSMGLRAIPGRMSLAHYAARMSAADAAGCDGVYLFNIENGFLHSVATLDFRAAREKLYFAVDRGSGGYRPDSWLKGGWRYVNMPLLDPGGNCTEEHPFGTKAVKTMKAGERYEFEIAIGDDLSASHGVKVTAIALTGLKGVSPGVAANGSDVKLISSADGFSTYEIPAAILRKGVNSFAVTFPEMIDGATAFNDFAVKVELR